MIGILDFFGPFFDHPDATAEIKEAAQEMLDKVNALLIEAEANGVDLVINYRTKTYVSGERYGGFRPRDCAIGALHSAHKEGKAVDVFDPLNDLDRWITDARLIQFDLYLQTPSSTLGWVHLQDKIPLSGKRTFQP